MTPKQIRWSAGGWVPILLLAISSTALAQSSTNFRLRPGTLTGVGNAGSSTNFRLVGTGSAPIGRSSSTNFDAIGGFVGGAFTSQATITHAMGAASYRALSFPLREASQSVTSVLSELGAVNNVNWRLGHFSPADAAYQEPGTSLNLATVDRGLGYWLITASATSVSSTGLPAPIGPFTLTLAGGANTWQQIGNPFLFPVAVNQLTVTDGIAAPVLLTAGGNTLTEQVIKEGNGAPYSNATVLNGRTGYFVKKLGAGTVRIIFPHQASATGSPEPALAKPAGASWAFGIAPRLGGRDGEPIVVGAADVAAGGWNPLDLSLAPAPPGESPLHLRLPKAGWGPLNGHYVRDFIPQAERMSWDFELAGAGGPGDVELSFHGYDVPAGMKFYLSDLTSGWTREIEPGAALSVATASVTRPFRLEARGSGQALPGTVTSDAYRVAYPNPFRATTGLNFSLVRGGDVSVEIFDIQGRMVRSLGRRGLAAGEHVLVWDGRDQAGRSIGNGVYLTRWRAGAVAGTGRLVKVD